MHLEITESVLMDRVDNALGTIIELQSFGFSVSIDDFGTGYSSLSYLSRLPIDTVKIDRSFVAGLGAGATGHDPSIVRAMLALANALDLDVVAEGVELTSQLDFSPTSAARTRKASCGPSRSEHQMRWSG